MTNRLLWEIKDYFSARICLTVMYRHIYAGTFSKISKIFKKHIYAGTEEKVDLQRKLQFHLIKKHIYGGIKNKIFKISHNAYICRSIHNIMPVHHCRSSVGPRVTRYVVSRGLTDGRRQIASGLKHVSYVGKASRKYFH